MTAVVQIADLRLGEVARRRASQCVARAVLDVCRVRAFASFLCAPWLVELTGYRGAVRSSVVSVFAGGVHL